MRVEVVKTSLDLSGNILILIKEEWDSLTIMAKIAEENPKALEYLYQQMAPLTTSAVFDEDEDVDKEMRDIEEEETDDDEDKESDVKKEDFVNDLPNVSMIKCGHMRKPIMMGMCSL